MASLPRCRWRRPRLPVSFSCGLRAPLSGLVLVTEMIASVTMLLPMLGACFVGIPVPTVPHDPPIYDSLSEAHRDSTSR
jgi:H+/Cl- antiporter ClcA